MYLVFTFENLLMSVAAAGECFCRSAQLQLELGSRHEAATHYVDAGNAYKKADPQGMIYNYIRLW